MFSLSVFTSYLPYLIIGIGYALYYAIALLSGAVQINEKQEKDANFSPVHSVSYQAKEQSNSTFQICFEEQIFVPETKNDIPSILIVSILALLTMPLLKTRHGFSLFSRPPPSVA